MWPLGSKVSRLEGGRAERVRVAPHEHRDDHLGLDAQPFLERAAEAAHDALLVAANRPLGQRGDLLRELLGALERGAARDDLVDKPDLERLLDADPTAR